MQTRDKVDGLLNGIPTPRVFISGYANTGKKGFLLLFLNNFPEQKSKAVCLRHWLKEKFLSVANVVHDVLYAKSVLVLQKIYFPKYGFFLLKLSA